MKNFKTLLCILALSTSITACQKESIDPPATTQTVPSKLQSGSSTDHTNRPNGYGPVKTTEAMLIRQK